MNVLGYIQPALKKHLYLSRHCSTKCYLIYHTFHNLTTCHPSVNSSSTLLKCLLPLQMKTRTITKSTEEKLRVKDSIPCGYGLVYRPSMSSYVITTQRASTGLCLIIGIAGCFKYFTSELLSSSPAVFEFGNVVQSNEQLYAFLGAFVLGNIVLQTFITQYPLRIYKNENNSYIAVFVGLLPLMTKQVSFSPGDVTRVPPSGIMPWKYSRLKIHNKNAIILQEQFRKPSDYHTMFNEK